MVYYQSTLLGTTGVHLLLSLLHLQDFSLNISDESITPFIFLKVYMIWYVSLNTNEIQIRFHHPNPNLPNSIPCMTSLKLHHPHFSPLSSPSPLPSDRKHLSQAAKLSTRLSPSRETRIPKASFSCASSRLRYEDLLSGPRGISERVLDVSFEDVWLDLWEFVRICKLLSWSKSSKDFPTCYQARDCSAFSLFGAGMNSVWYYWIEWPERQVFNALTHTTGEWFFPCWECCLSSSDGVVGRCVFETDWIGSFGVERCAAMLLYKSIKERRVVAFFWWVFALRPSWYEGPRVSAKSVRLRAEVLISLEQMPRRESKIEEQRSWNANTLRCLKHIMWDVRIQRLKCKMHGV